MFQMQPPNMRSRPSLTACELRWRSTAFLSAPSTTPSSAPPPPPSPRGQRPPNPSGHVSQIKGDQVKKGPYNVVFSISEFHQILDFVHQQNVFLSFLKKAVCISASAALYTQKPLGVSPDEAVTEIVKTLNNKKKEVVIAPSLPKVAIYTRSFFPNVFFAVMAAGVNHAAASEKM